jgi:DNA-binding GntR family transcriptional regulator
MRRAIEYLVHRGLLIRKRGVAPRVGPGRRQVERTRLYDDLAKTRRSPVTRVLSFVPEPIGDPVAAELGLAEGTAVYAFEQLRYAEAKRLAPMHNNVPAHLLPLTADDLQTHGLYNRFRAPGITLKIAGIDPS